MAEPQPGAHRALGLGIAATLFVADQFFKWLVTGPLGLEYEGQSIQLLPFFDLTLVHNVGVSLGMMPADSAAMRWGLVTLTGAIAIAVAIWLWRETRKWDAIGLSMILGGAAGNILDRVRFGYVVDYADLHFGTFRPFLVFNVADAAITFGVLMLLARALLSRDGPSNEEKADA